MAEQCGQLQLYDELLVVNDVDVSQMDHGDVVQLIKASGTSIKLVVQQPDGEWVCAVPVSIAGVVVLMCQTIHTFYRKKHNCVTRKIQEYATH